MKVNGTNQSNLQIYKNQMHKQMDTKKHTTQKDQLEISNTAKHLQENAKVHTKRQSYVQEIKNAVDRGEYQINHEKTAQKMIDFWSKQ